MANVDNPNGFSCVMTLSGGAPTRLSYTTAASQSIKKGDAVSLSLATSLVTLANSVTPRLFGVAAHDVTTTAADERYPLLVYPFDSNNVFEAQCSGTFSLARIGSSVDIEGTTGIQEVNEDATVEQVLRIIGYNPLSEIGANARVWVTGARSQFNDYQDAEP